MTSIMNTGSLFVFSFLMKAVLCTLTTTMEPPRRLFITSDNIPPFPDENGTNNDTFTPQDPSNASDGTSDEKSMDLDNHNITDEDTVTNMEGRGLFMYPIRSKPVRRQVHGDVPFLTGNIRTTLPPTMRSAQQGRDHKLAGNNLKGRLLLNQEKYQPLANQQQTLPGQMDGDKNSLGSVNVLFANQNRGRQFTQPLFSKGSLSPQEMSPLFNNRRINEQDISSPSFGGKSVLGSVNQPSAGNRGRQSNQQGYQPFNNQNSFPSEDIRLIPNNRQINQQPGFSAPFGRDENIVGSVNNVPFATQYNNTPYKTDPRSCDRRGMCNTVTQTNLFQNTYKLIEQFSSDQYETTMCFTEIIYVTEIDFSDTLLISKELVWTIETTEHTNTPAGGYCGNILDTVNSPPLELTNTEKFEGRVVKEYRIKHCGVGNLFKHEYSSWPNNDRRMIQVTVSNSSLLQCRRQQTRDSDSNLGEQLQTTPLNPFIYRSTMDANMNTYVTEMPRPSSFDQPTSNPGEYIHSTGFTPGPPVVQAQRVEEELVDGQDDFEKNMNDYLRIIIDCVMKNKDFKGMCPHSAKSRN